MEIEQKKGCVVCYCCIGVCILYKFVFFSFVWYICRRQIVVDLILVWCCDILFQFVFCCWFWVLLVERFDIRSWFYFLLLVFFCYFCGVVGYLVELFLFYIIIYLWDMVWYLFIFIILFVQLFLKFKFLIFLFCLFFCFFISF